MKKKKFVQIPAFVRWIALFCLLLNPTDSTSLFAGRDGSPSKAGFGPLWTHNQQPIQLMFLGFNAEPATALPKGQAHLRFGVSQTSTLLDEEEGKISAKIDMETTRITFDSAHGFGHGLEAGIEIPFNYISNGFLDPFIRGVEHLVNRPNPIRERTPPNDFNMEIKVEGETMHAAKNGAFGIGDIILRVKEEFVQEEFTHTAFGFRLGAKIPTGNRDLAFGSGKADFGGGFLLETRFNKIAIYANGDAILPGKVNFKGLKLGPFFSWSAALEYLGFKKWSLVSQMQGTARPFDDTGNVVTQEKFLDLILGANWALGRNLFLQIGGIENVSAWNSDSDFTLFTNLRWRFSSFNRTQNVHAEKTSLLKFCLIPC